MQRPDFITAFLWLLGLFNLGAVAFVLSGLSSKTVDEATFYGGVAIGCFSALFVLNVMRRRG